jgi:hypothetical protein
MVFQHMQHSLLLTAGKRALEIETGKFCIAYLGLRGGSSFFSNGGGGLQTLELQGVHSGLVAFLPRGALCRVLEEVHARRGAESAVNAGTHKHLAVHASDAHQTLALVNGHDVVAQRPQQA